MLHDAHGWILAGMLLLIGCGKSPSSVNEIGEPSASEQNAAQAESPPSTGPEKQIENTASKPRSDEDPVAVVFKAPASGLRTGQIFEVSVVLDIASFYEIHDRDAGPPAVPTRLELKLPDGFRALDEWTAPEPVRSMMPDGHPVYVGEATFYRDVQIEHDAKPGDYGFSCSIRYQACTERFCFPPKSVKLSVAVRVLR